MFYLLIATLLLTLFGHTSSESATPRTKVSSDDPDVKAALNVRSIFSYNIQIGNRFVFFNPPKKSISSKPYMIPISNPQIIYFFIPQLSKNQSPPFVPFQSFSTVCHTRTQRTFRLWYLSNINIVYHSFLWKRERCVSHELLFHHHVNISWIQCTNHHDDVAWSNLWSHCHEKFRRRRVFFRDRRISWIFRNQHTYVLDTNGGKT